MNFNRVIMAGNLTRDPELSYLPSQTAVVDFGIAVNRKWFSKAGEEKSEVCFIDCKAFGRSAENLNKYSHKGDPLLIEGRLTLDTWTSKDGTKQSRHRIVIDNFQFLGQQSSTPAESRGLSCPAKAEKGINQNLDIKF